MDSKAGVAQMNFSKKFNQNAKFREMVERYAHKNL